MRLVSFETDGPGRRASCWVTRSCRSRRSTLRPMSVEGLLEALDADGLRELAARAEAATDRLPLAGSSPARPGAGPSEDHLPGPQLPRPRGGVGTGDPLEPDVVREVRELALIGSGRRDPPARGAPRLRRLRGRAGGRDRASGAPCQGGRGARSYVAGAMPFNDVSARDLQLQNPLWTSGKAIDTFAPCGPALVTLDEAGDLSAPRPAHADQRRAACRRATPAS